MHETVELKHSARERWRQSLFLAGLLLLMTWLESTLSNATSSGVAIYIVGALVSTSFQWWYLSRQLIRVNRKGIYVWQYGRGRFLRWDEIGGCEMSWERKLEDFLLTSYDLNNLQGHVKLLANNAKPLQFKVNFDSMAQRQRLKAALTFHLGSPESSQENPDVAALRWR